MFLTAVVAYTQNRVIGIDNQLPWRLPDDLKFFKEQTLHKPILMGRKTFEAIGRLLPQRQTIILSRKPTYQVVGAEVISHLEQLQNVSLISKEVMVIGGGQIYRLCLPYCQKVLATEIKVTLQGDAFFPELKKEEWREVARCPHTCDEQHLYAFDFVEYHRNML